MEYDQARQGIDNLDEVRDYLSRVVSGKNPDGTSFLLPSSAQSGAVIQFRPEDYGAKRDGVTDDTAAINAARAAARARAEADGSNYFEIHWSSGIYQVNGPLLTTEAGYAQIPIFNVDGADAKLAEVWVLPDTGAEMPHWLETNDVPAGTVIRSGLANPSYSATHGAPSIIGGPTVENGYGNGYAPAAGSLFSNVMFRVVGCLTVVAPLDMSINGLDLRGVAEMDIDAFDARSAGHPSSYVLPSAGYFGDDPESGSGQTSDLFATALVMPGKGNNAISVIRSLSVQNWYCGLGAGEHGHVHDARLIYCRVGVDTPAAATHACRIDKLCIEACRTHIYGTPNWTGGNTILDIGTWDFEDADAPFNATFYIDDGGNALRGTIRYVGQGGPLPRNRINSAHNVRLYDLRAYPGFIAAPAVPASTVEYRNDQDRDLLITIHGGTVSDITIDTQSTGLTSGAFVLSPQKAIKLTYTAAPTWAMWAL